MLSIRTENWHATSVRMLHHHVTPSQSPACPELICCAGDNVPEDVRGHLQGAAVAIWTTTGWTIPANQAVAVNERLQYALVEAQACFLCHCLSSCKMLICDHLPF